MHGKSAKVLFARVWKDISLTWYHLCLYDILLHIHTQPNIRSSCFFSAARAKRPWGWGCWLWVLMKQESMWKFVFQILFIMGLMVQTIWMCETMAILPHGEKDSRLRLSKLCWENSKFWVKKAFWRETAAYSRKCEKEDVNKKSGREGEQVQKMREEPAKSGWLRKFVSLPAGFDELMKVSLQLPHILSVNIEPCSNSAFPFAQVFLTKQW